MTSMNQLLSRRRLRLISRMFIQMCDAVDACHRMGISHRDIKPENFICCEEDNKGVERRVMVKLTDWGLGTRDAECTDFDCGSKPYMAYGSYFTRFLSVWLILRLQNAAIILVQPIDPFKPTSGLSA